jgi:epoxyqueuosine reductase
MKHAPTVPEAPLFDPRLLAKAIKDRAHAEGFDKIGIVRAASLASERERLKQWLELGYHGDMRWMAREPAQRTDPRQFFPEARSVIVVALNYYTPHQHAEDPETGKISRYAWGNVARPTRKLPKEASIDIWGASVLALILL